MQHEKTKNRHAGIPALWTQMLETGLWTLDSESWSLSFERWYPDPGRWRLDCGRENVKTLISLKLGNNGAKNIFIFELFIDKNLWLFQVSRFVYG